MTGKCEECGGGVLCQGDRPGQWPPPLSLSEPEPESLSVRGSSAGEQTEKQDIWSVTLVCFYSGFKSRMKVKLCMTSLEDSDEENLVSQSERQKKVTS